MRKMCEVLGVSRSGYYSWLGRPESRRSRANRELLSPIRLAHQRSRKTYGSPRVTEELHAQGLTCGENRVARLMRRHGIRAQGKRNLRPIDDGLPAPFPGGAECVESSVHG